MSAFQVRVNELNKLLDQLKEIDPSGRGYTKYKIRQLKMALLFPFISIPFLIILIVTGHGDILTIAICCTLAWFIGTIFDRTYLKYIPVFYDQKGRKEVQKALKEAHEKIAQYKLELDQLSEVKKLFSDMRPILKDELNGDIRFEDRLGDHNALVRYELSGPELGYELTADGYTIFKRHLSAFLAGRT